MSANDLNVRSVAPDQERQDLSRRSPRPRKRPAPSPGDDASALQAEAERRQEMALAEPDLGGRVHATA